jgi:hypothetical protein
LNRTQLILTSVDVVNNVCRFVAAGGKRQEFPNPWDLALLHATQAGVVAVTAAGNSGPGLGTVINIAPW